ncbi:RDD domain-containing protein [Planococcus antarcticus DSM 14505]|uniref:RDD domain-containing protein n=1 Tax=Planococcus antarcticus DSM 14505 TaxID=1185653 RepID=A0A1C7DJM3_9BACL|nr:RDD family protein [Planococcus antarcticus]ANU11413.1 hypothetical protein BBH88_14465 [Planococcus antarcticus DSM 14505]EIM06639.1 RDD domain-containing protein [Planococcus antarcticus DSM 14505]
MALGYTASEDFPVDKASSISCRNLKADFHCDIYVGKRKTRIRVADENNRPVSFYRSTFRIALKFLPWELSHFMAYRMIYLEDGERLPLDYLIGGLVYALILLYVLITIFTKNKQSFYNRLTKTCVVKSIFPENY